MPWATINLQGYYWENELATRDTKGNVYSLEMMLSPSLQLDYNYDDFESAFVFKNHKETSSCGFGTSFSI